LSELSRNTACRLPYGQTMEVLLHRSGSADCLVLVFGLSNSASGRSASKRGIRSKTEDMRGYIVRSRQKQLTTRKTIGEQQRAFDPFMTSYNQERPHEALGQKPPASVYKTSSRKYNAKTEAVDYPRSFEHRYIKDSGDFKWRGKAIYLSVALEGETIGLKQVDNATWQIYFSFYPLGSVDDLTLKITPIKSVTHVSG